MCEWESNPGLSWQNAAFNKKRSLLTNKLELRLTKKLVKSGALLCAVLKGGQFGQRIRNILVQFTPLCTSIQQYLFIYAV